MSEILLPVNELRGAYDQFLKSPAGKDFLSKLVAYETALMISAYPQSDHEKKAQAIDKASGIYWVRTLLEDLSKPKATVAVRRGSTRPSVQ